MTKTVKIRDLSSAVEDQLATMHDLWRTLAPRLHDELREPLMACITAALFYSRWWVHGGNH